MRYTPSIPSVNSTRFRRSAICQRFFSGLFSIFLTLAARQGPPYTLELHSVGGALRAAYRFRRSTRGGNLLRRLAAELVRPHRQLLCDVPAGQHLDLPRAANNTALAQQLRCHHGTSIEPLGDRVEIHHRVLGPERDEGAPPEIGRAHVCTG